MKLLAKPISANEYRKYYFNVGKSWNWIDRMVMEDEELEKKINAKGTEVYVLTVEGREAGYCEFVPGENFCEIQYFGLFEDFVGRGLGKVFLNWAVEKAWTYNAKHIQLNTCSLDHPRALETYKKAGFKIVNTKTEERKISVR
ncbi:MAG: GNAT family N-acetyltransferase [Bacteroidia bacterium]|nr:GNAT family N-acetyltransferase [Bacteroidia bacterium]